MLEEALDIISGLFDGDTMSYRGNHFDVESARLWDLPDQRVPIGLAVSGRRSCRLAGERADLMIATEPKPELGEMFDAAGGSGKPRVGQIAVSYDPDRDTAVARAHEQFRWFGLGWKVNADLPGPSSFEAATQFVTPDQVAEQLPCGPDVQEHVDKIRPFIDAGFTEIALVQIGGGQPGGVHRVGRARAAAGAAFPLSAGGGPSGGVGRGLHDPAGDVTQLEVHALGGPGQHLERLVTGEVALVAQDADGLADDLTGLERGPELRLAA